MAFVVANMRPLSRWQRLFQTSRRLAAYRDRSFNQNWLNSHSTAPEDAVIDLEGIDSAIRPSHPDCTQYRMKVAEGDWVVYPLA